MSRILALIMLPLALGAGCSSGHAQSETDDDVLEGQMAARGWARDTRVLDRAQVVPFAKPAQSIDDMVERASVAWGVNPRKIRKVIKSGSRLDPARLDLLAAASASSGVPVRYLLSAMASTRKTAMKHGLAFPHHLAMVATLAMFDPQPYKIHANFQSAVQGLASASLPAVAPTLGLSDRILVLDRWRRSHQAGTMRDGCLDSVITDPGHRQAVSLLLQDYYMVVFCDLVGRFGCASGLAWQELAAYSLPDGVSNRETWRVMEASRQVLLWVDR